MEAQAMELPAQLENLRVVLVAPRNPLNIGAAARAMANFGARNLRVVNPYEVAFRDARSAVGAEDLLMRAEEFRCLADAVADCALVVGTTAAGRREPQHVLHPLAGAAALISPRLEKEQVALLFGSEKRGLTNDDLTHCNWLLHIPTHQRQPSMNLAQAVAVCLYEVVRMAARVKEVERTGGAASAGSAGAAELERLATVLIEALQVSGYTLADKGAVTEQNVRRLIRRLAPAKEDAELLLGMLRQILWKLRAGTHS